MKYTMKESLKKIIWYGISNSTFEDTRNCILNDYVFLGNLKNKRNATIHLSKKHFPFVVKKTVTEMLSKQHYVVTSVKYHFWGMDVLVSPK